MRRPQWCLLLLTSLVGVGALPGSARADLAFPRGIYWAWERTAPMAKQMKLDLWQYVERQVAELHDRDHMNLIWTVNIGTQDLIRLSAVAAKHGVQVAGTPEPVLWYRTDRSPAGIAKTAGDSVKLLKGANGLAAYVLIDEPTLWEMDQMENLRAALRKADPTRQVVVVTMVGTTDAARLRTHFPVLTTDCYPFFAAGDPNGPNTPAASKAYYRNTCDALAAALAREGRALWAMPQCFVETWGPWYYGPDMSIIEQPGAYSHWRQPTVGEIRWQIWQAIASGAKGVVFFLLHPEPLEGHDKPSTAAAAPEGVPRLTKEVNTGQGGALLNPDGSPTPQLKATAAAFADCERLEKTLAGMKPLDTPVAFAGGPLHLGLFRTADGAACVAVVNDDTDRDTVGRITLLPGVASATDLRTDQKLSVATGADGLPTVTVNLKPGDGTLLALSWDGPEPALTFSEDFSSPQGPVGATGGGREIDVKGFGVGWSYALTPTRTAQPGTPMTVDLDVKQIAGEGSGAAYLVYDAWFPEGKEAVELSAMTDGKTFGRISIDAPNQPIRIPANATQLRLKLAPEAGLRSLRVVRGK